MFLLNCSVNNGGEALPLKKDSGQITYLRSEVRHAKDTLLGKLHLKISGGGKKSLKLVLSVDVSSICEKDTINSESLFGESLVESMRVDK